MITDDATNDFFKRHPHSPLLLMFAMMALLLLGAAMSGRMHRAELDGREIDSAQYVDLLRTVRTYPELSRRAEAAAADKIVTAGEMRDIQEQATVIQRRRTVSTLSR